VIKYGPPASGKGHIAPKLCDILGIHRYVDVNVDRYVEYIVHIQAGKTGSIDQQTYRAIRPTANRISDAVLAHAMHRKLDIMWETTGRSVDLRWMVDAYIAPARARGYAIVLTLPIVGLHTLLARCKAREQAADCTMGYLGAAKRDSSRNFALIAQNSDRVLVYDNNQNPSTLLFDSADSRRACDPLPDRVAHNAAVKPVVDYMQRACRRVSGRTGPPKADLESPGPVSPPSRHRTSPLSTGRPRAGRSVHHVSSK
jgi:adenylate kinase family enzyme